MSENNTPRPLSNREVALFCEQLSITLSAGISATEGIRILLEEAGDKQEKELLSIVIAHLENNEPLHASLKSSGVFPSYMLNMIRIGEETGTLDEVTASLSLYYQREDAVRRAVKEAVTYPLIMTCMMATVIVVLLVKVMPIFNQVYNQLGTELTGFAKFLLEAGTIIGTYYAPIFVTAAGIIMFLILFSRSGRGRALSQRSGLSKELYSDMAAMRFASGMSLTLKAGLDVDQSLELVEPLNDNSLFQIRLDSCKEKLARGVDFTQAVFESGIFSGSYARMLSVGAKAGAVDHIMDRISDLYQEQVDARINSRIARIEPALIIALSVIVGSILLSVMLPLIGMLAGL